jgi:hypothetical protein
VYNLLLGRFSKQFIDIQSAYIHHIDKDSKMTGQTWSTAFLVELWNLPWEMWEHCNGILHGATNTPQQQCSVEELLLEVNAELEQGPDTLLVPDQQLVDRDPNTSKLCPSTSSSNGFLQSTKPEWPTGHTNTQLTTLKIKIQALSIGLFENGSSPPLPTLPQTI